MSGLSEWLLPCPERQRLDRAGVTPFPSHRITGIPGAISRKRGKIRKRRNAATARNKARSTEKLNLQDDGKFLLIILPLSQNLMSVGIKSDNVFEGLAGMVAQGTEVVLAGKGDQMFKPAAVAA